MWKCGFKYTFNFNININRISILIYIEIIEINICNISFNTKRNIEIRSGIESFIEFRSLLPSNEEEEEKEDDDISAEATFELVYKKKH